MDRSDLARRAVLLSLLTWVGNGRLAVETSRIAAGCATTTQNAVSRSPQRQHQRQQFQQSAFTTRTGNCGVGAGRPAPVDAVSVGNCLVVISKKVLPRAIVRCSGGVGGGHRLRSRPIWNEDAITRGAGWTRRAKFRNGSLFFHQCCISRSCFDRVGVGLDSGQGCAACESEGAVGYQVNSIGIVDSGCAGHQDSSSFEQEQQQQLSLRVGAGAGLSRADFVKGAAGATAAVLALSLVSVAEHSNATVLVLRLLWHGVQWIAL